MDNEFGITKKAEYKTEPTTDKRVHEKQVSGPAGTLTPLGMATDQLHDSLVVRVKRYFRNVFAAMFRPNDIFAPVKINMAGGALQYTLSEDVRKMRGEAYDAGLRAGNRMTEKLERYCEGGITEDGIVIPGGTAIAIFERGKTYGYNNGFTDGRNERAEGMEEALGTFEDLEEYYNKGPDEVVALIGKKFVTVYGFDDAISVYKRRYGEEQTRQMLSQCIDRDKEKMIEDMLDPERTKPQLPVKSDENLESEITSNRRFSKKWY